MTKIYRYGYVGEDLKHWQKLLNVESDGIFGAQTKRALQGVQRENGLVVDGVLGPISQAVLDPVEQELINRRRSFTISGVRMLALSIAKRFIGHSEVSENSSPLIDEWMADLGITWPAPWCMGFVQMCFKKAFKECGPGFEDGLKPDTAHCLTLWKACKKKGWTVGPLDGQAGDIAIFDWGGGAGHTGIVSGYDGGYYIIVEGNTNDAGSREGDCVAIKNRYKYNDKLLGFIRVPDPEVKS